MTVSHYLVLGLTLGDEGKAGIVDLLASQSKSSTVIRFAADPHSAHYLVTPDEGVVTFGQIGSGMINSTCRTHIGHDSLLRLPSLMVEVDELKKLGVSVLGRLTIDPETVLVLPWHVLAERVLEISRGSQSLGASGSGSSIARHESTEDSSNAVRFKHVFGGKTLLERLTASYSKTMEFVTHSSCTYESPRIRQLVRDFTSRFSIESVAYDLSQIGMDLRCSVAHDEEVLQRGCEETFIFEGTQGLLLNPEVGLRPHVSACDSSKRNAESMIQRGDNCFPLKTIGVMRSYSTRFGAGPLVTEDSALTGALPELHNGASPWSGNFRAGDLDLITTRYALRASGGVDALALNHLDRIGKLPEVKVCTAYEYFGTDIERVKRNFCSTIRDGRVFVTDVLTENRIEEVTELLFDMKPADYRTFPSWRDWTPRFGWTGVPKGLSMFLDFLQGHHGLNTPIAIVSFGVHRADKYTFSTL